MSYYEEIIIVGKNGGRVTVTNERLDVNAVVTIESVETEPTFKDDPSNAAEAPKYGKRNSVTLKQQVEADVSGTVALDDATLAALENISAIVSGTVALDTATLAALETINAIVSGSVSVSNMIPAVETGLAKEATLLSIKNTDGIKKITDALPAGTNNIGMVYL